MQLVPTSNAIQDLERLLGREVSVETFHGALRRAAQSLRGVEEVGTVLATCSDEFQGEVRAAFDRDVARPLMANQMVGSRRTFALSNLGGRVEPGALALADDHFTVRSRRGGTKLLIVEITAHVGRLIEGHEVVHGVIDRFGVRSPCCGALTLLLEAPATTAAVRHPWFDQLSAFLGPRRLDVLRADPTPMRMVKAGLVHAVLQAETALADLLREGPKARTRVLLAAVLVVNQRGSDAAVLAGFHQLSSEGAELHLEHGVSLRSTPEALSVRMDSGRLVVDVDEEHRPEEPAGAARGPEDLHRELVEMAPAVRQAAASVHKPALHAHLRRVQAQAERARQKPRTWRVFARPLLRGLMQGLSIVAPEVGLAAMALQVGHDALKTRELKRLLSSGPSGDAARKVLKDMEAEIQQLPHHQAQQVLDVLLAETSPLWKL